MALTYETYGKWTDAGQSPKIGMFQVLLVCSSGLNSSGSAWVQAEMRIKPARSGNSLRDEL